MRKNQKDNTGSYFHNIRLPLCIIMFTKASIHFQPVFAYVSSATNWFKMSFKQVILTLSDGFTVCPFNKPYVFSFWNVSTCTFTCSSNQLLVLRKTTVLLEQLHSVNNSRWLFKIIIIVVFPTPFHPRKRYSSSDLHRSF